jgi:hypothetical protein
VNEPLAPVVSSTAVPATAPVAVAEPDAPVVPAPAQPARDCQNCGAALDGEYCAACGQRDEPHVHSLGHFASEAFESVTHADSRLWRTIGYLLVRPGFLSREFFDGRRARYLPPFRLYLVISVLFFVVTGLAGHGKVAGGAEESPPTTASIAALRESADQLEADLPNTPGIPLAAAEMRRKAAAQEALLAGGTNPQATPADATNTGQVDTNLCADGQPAPGPDASWSQEALYNFCHKVRSMRGEDLINSVMHNIPRAMFVFLPLLAAVMMMLYWRPRRFYVEHLLFLVHNHAFVFLALTLLAIALRVPVVGEHLGLLSAAVWIYLFYYIFRAMRVYYGQSRVRTFAKYLFIGFAYITSGALVLAGTAIYSALTL